MGAVYMAGHSKNIWSARYHFAFGYFTSVHLINFIKTYNIHIYIFSLQYATRTRDLCQLWNSLSNHLKSLPVYSDNM